MCKAKSEKEKQTCEAKNSLKRKLENDEEVENKGFNIDGDMTKSLEHLDHHTKDLFQSTKEVLDENLQQLGNCEIFYLLTGEDYQKKSTRNRSNFW